MKIFNQNILGPWVQKANEVVRLWPFITTWQEKKVLCFFLWPLRIGNTIPTTVFRPPSQLAGSDRVNTWHGRVMWVESWISWRVVPARCCERQVWVLGWWMGEGVLLGFGAVGVVMLGIWRKVGEVGCFRWEMLVGNGKLELLLLGWGDQISQSI